jgi:hypothetical protein
MLNGKQKELIKSKYARFQFPGIVSSQVSVGVGTGPLRHLSMELSNYNSPLLT